MIVSPNKIIGSLVYRTREALCENSNFIENLRKYDYHKNFLIKGKMSLWHYPGTNNEISNALLDIGKHPKGVRLKFPSILNFQSIRQDKSSESVRISYNLAIVCIVRSEWTTEQREKQVFDCVLRPIYEEFINQINLCNYFQKDYGIPEHTYYEIFTTGGNSNEIANRYGDYIDAIELHNLSLRLNPRLCMRDFDVIEKENELVTSNIKNILN